VALLVLDSSVLIAFLDPGDAHHENASRALEGAAADDLVIPASAYAEVLVHPYRLGRAAVRRVERVISDFAMRVELIGVEIAAEAAKLRAARRGVTLPDALVLATGEVLRANVVLTTDRAWPNVSRRARVI
jgi:predicted nucleic acid-binding protein